MGALYSLKLAGGIRFSLTLVNDDFYNIPLGSDVSEEVIYQGRNVLSDGTFDPTTFRYTQKYILSNDNYMIVVHYGEGLEVSTHYFIDIEFFMSDDTRVYSVSHVGAWKDSVTLSFNKVEGGYRMAIMGKGYPNRDGIICGLTTPEIAPIPDEWFTGSEQEDDDESKDPFADDSESGTGGNDGNFDDESDEIPVPPLPEEYAINTGFLTIFRPTSTQIQSLASFMWSTLDIENWRKIFANPMDAIIGLTSYPFNIPSGGTKEIKVGGLSSGVACATAGHQYIEINCGTISVSKYWGAYLDYAPYSNIDLYLPFVGIRTLNMDDVQDCALGVKYHIDILSGSCVAYVTSNGNVIYQFAGQCGEQIPITSGDHNNLISAGINIAGSVIGGIASGGSGALVGASALLSTANAVINNKPNISRSGSISGNVSMLSLLTPYAIITRPSQCAPANQNAFKGYPLFATYTLGKLSGYTEVESIHLEGINATDSEKREIESLLMGGVIL